eukprot:gb/GFBE01048067.1/.p1 GENE.gb/GFBE01048067.1/~~gb/GFBE01048067.1/.p1  ORF type:complete len:373 (+),score=72.93 gb/GFBE01048067.1/:1-1119(+)
MKGREVKDAKASEPAEEDYTAAATVVVGTYDGGLLGFGLEDGAQVFGYAPHAGCVKAVHCNHAGKLASGATDNTVRLFDLARGVEMGELQEHEDTVCALQFWGTSNLVTGSSDGQVCIWRCSDYEILLKFRGHKAAVTCLAVHPSGRMMASAGRDNRIQLWDLTRGTSAAHLTVDESVEVLEWSPSGESIAALSPRELLTVQVAGCDVATFRDAGSAGFMRVSLVATTFLGEGVLALGDGKGDVRIITRGDTALEEACRLPMDAPTPGSGPARVKSLVRSAGDQLVVGMSSGCVEVWRYAAKKMGFKGRPEASDFTKLRVVDTKARLTSLAVWVPGQELPAPAQSSQKQEAPPKEAAAGKKGKACKKRKQAA